MTFHLHLTGQVQGVGFRPFVWQLARTMKLQGSVRNGADGVHIYINTDPATAQVFANRVQTEAPAIARIQSVELREIESIHFDDFSIVDSQVTGATSLQLTPDLALCDACRKEIDDPANRRFGYAFTTCTHCGPRYSILQKVPYDRPTTTMAPFAMCVDCEREYSDPTNRRFYAQTNSCPNCLVELSLFSASGQRVIGAQTELIGYVIDALKASQTVAVKGIGGYLLLCDATNANAIRQLRERKYRPAKPLAVLYSNVHQLQQDCYLGEDEVALLRSPASPIVLLERRLETVSGLAVDQLAPGLSQLGVMLPYAPLLMLIAEAFDLPLVATSGNVSGSPICYTNQQVLEQLPAVADLILTHNRDIVVPQDDSVMRLSPTYRQPIVMRRSRGLAPTSNTTPYSLKGASREGRKALISTPFSTPKSPEGDFVQGQAKSPSGDLGVENPDFIPSPTDATSPTRLAFRERDITTNILALGASLKSTFSWQLRGNTYVSQYLGDLESYDTQTSFRATLNHFLQLFEATPEVILADQHEGYFSTQLAHELATIWGVPLVSIQHHEAHLAAVLAENKLTTGDEPVLGVIWDGTGYGADGQIWGGEFIRYQHGIFDRVGHFDYFDSLLGDKMPREPRLTALSLAFNLPGADALLRSKFTDKEWSLYSKLPELGKTRLKTSSVGRLFDAVASLLGLIDRVSYEGEAALLLETTAAQYVLENGYEASQSYFPDALMTTQIPTRAIVAGVVRDSLAGFTINQIAASFHYTLVKAVAIMARQMGIRQLVFSGGVFQNALLVDWLRHELEPTCQLYFHHQLSPNDECISFGQLAYFSLTASTTTSVKTETAYVLSHSR